MKKEIFEKVSNEITNYAMEVYKKEYNLLLDVMKDAPIEEMIDLEDVNHEFGPAGAFFYPCDDCMDGNIIGIVKYDNGDIMVLVQDKHYQYKPMLLNLHELIYPEMQQLACLVNEILEAE